MKHTCPKVHNTWIYSLINHYERIAVSHHWGMLPCFFQHCPLVVVQLLNCVQLFVTPLTAARQASLSFTVSLSLLKHMSIESVMTSSHLILCCPLLLLPSIFPSIKVLYLIYSISLSGSWIILKYLLNCKHISNVPKDKMERWIDIIKDLSQLNEYISVN